MYNVFEKELGVDTTKMRFHAVHELARRFKAHTDQLLQDLFAGKTDTRFG